MREVEHMCLRLLQLCELLIALLLAEQFCLHILAPKYRVGRLETSAAKGHSHGHSQQLIWRRVDEVIKRARARFAWLKCCPTEVLKLLAAVLPENRHQGQNKIGLVEFLALTVNADKNFCNLLLLDVGRELQCGERVARQIKEVL